MASTTAVDVVMPQMGVSVSEGTVTKWSKSVGDTIEADETLLEISTDKVDTEVPSPATGVVTEILVQEGETVEVGTVLARIGGGGPAAAAPVAPPEPPTQPAADESAAAATEGQAAPEPEPPAPAPAAQAPQAAAADNGKAFVSPVVARIAAEHGIDPSQVPGTGTGGRVTKKDILGFVESGPLQPPAPEPQAQPAPEPAQAVASAPAEAQAPPAAKPAAAPCLRRSVPPRQAKPSSRCPRCGAGSPSTCAARSTRPRTSRRRSRST